MNHTLKSALEELETLPDSEQEAMAAKLLDMIARRRVDAELAEAEAEGGEIAHDAVFRRLRGGRA